MCDPRSAPCIVHVRGAPRTILYLIRVSSRGRPWGAHRAPCLPRSCPAAAAAATQGLSRYPPRSRVGARRALPARAPTRNPPLRRRGGCVAPSRRAPSQPAAAGRGHDSRGDHARRPRRLPRPRPPVAARPASDGWNTDASGGGGTVDAAGVCRCRPPRGGRSGERHGRAARASSTASVARRPVRGRTPHRRSGAHDRRRCGVRRGLRCTNGGVEIGRAHV